MTLPALQMLPVLLVLHFSTSPWTMWCDRSCRTCPSIGPREMVSWWIATNITNTNAILSDSCLIQCFWANAWNAWKNALKCRVWGHWGVWGHGCWKRKLHPLFSFCVGSMDELLHAKGKLVGLTKNHSWHTHRIHPNNILIRDFWRHGFEIFWITMCNNLWQSGFEKSLLAFERNTWTCWCLAQATEWRGTSRQLQIFQPSPSVMLGPRVRWFHQIQRKKLKLLPGATKTPYYLQILMYMTVSLKCTQMQRT